MKKWVTIFMLALLVSCNNETVYHKFVNIEGGKWTKQNKFTFEAGSFDSDMTVDESVELRLWARDYPYGNISILVEQTLFPAKTKTVDTLTYVFSRRQGDRETRRQGDKETGRQGDRETRSPDGPAFFQVSMPLKTLSLHKGDSLSVTLRHNMKCMALPGVVDVGLKLKNTI
ncbi:MAG: hypothetical protein II758_01005 [Prevotella sp.]|nr:hypothetical protein [Prevotella sp.]